MHPLPAQEAKIHALLRAMSSGDAAAIRSISKQEPDFPALAEQALDYCRNKATHATAAGIVHRYFSYPPTRSEAISTILMPSPGQAKSRAQGRAYYRPYADALRAMIDAGWIPGADAAAALLRRDALYYTPDFLAAMAETNTLPRAALEQSADGAICCLWRNDEPADAANIFDHLLKNGVNTPDNALIGPTDLLCRGNLNAARHLHSIGFPLEPVKRPWRYVSQGLPPAVALALYSGSGAYMPGCGSDPEIQAQRDAASKTVLEAIEWLRDIGCDFNPDDKPGLSTLCAALFETDERQWPLYAAAARKFAELGADPNHDNRAFMISALANEGWSGRTRKTEFALELGAHAQGATGPALAAVCSLRNEDAALTRANEILADPRFKLDLADVKAECPRHEHPIATAIHLQRHKLAQHFLALPIPHHWSDNGTTLLHLLANRSSKPALRLLEQLLALPQIQAQIDSRAAADYEDGPTLTPLMIACGSANIQGAKILLAAGANPNLQDKDGRSPLHHLSRKYGAKSKDKIAPLLELLLEAGADPALANKSGKSALQLMAKKSPLPAIERLAKLKATDLLADNDNARKAAKDLTSRPDRSAGEALLLNLDLDQNLPNATDGASLKSTKPKKRL